MLYKTDAAPISVGPRDSKTTVWPVRQGCHIIGQITQKLKSFPVPPPASLDALATHANPDMWKEYQLLPVPPPAPLDGIG